MNTSVKRWGEKYAEHANERIFGLLVISVADFYSRVFSVITVISKVFHLHN